MDTLAAPTTLEYRLVSLNPNDTFDRARPWNGVLAAWQCQLADSRLEARSNDAFAELALARANIEPLLRAWEAVAFLDGLYEIRFRFERGGTGGGPLEEEAAPPDAGSDEAGAGADDPIYRRVNTDYPAPDPAFNRTPLVESLLAEIGRFRRGDVSLTAAAAAAFDQLTPLAAGSSQPAALAGALSTDPAVIDRFAELTARAKAEPGPNDSRPTYRGPEWQWLQEALLRLTLQAGRAASGPPQSKLTLGDFQTQL